MCGRYHINDETAKQIETLIRQADEKLRRESAAALLRISETDVYPSDEAPILLPADGRITCAWLRWGFPLQPDQGKGLVFNARCESAAQKPLFRDGIRHRRIVVPAAAFYEWDRAKSKYTFRKDNGGVLFLAGCCRQYKDGEHFVILTTEANGSMKPVHDRMPLVLSDTEAVDWILDAGRTDSLLRQVPPPLERSTEYEQMRFF